MKVVKNFKELNGGDTCLRMNLQGKFLVKTDAKKKMRQKKLRFAKHDVVSKFSPSIFC